MEPILREKNCASIKSSDRLNEECPTSQRLSDCLTISECPTPQRLSDCLNNSNNECPTLITGELDLTHAKWVIFNSEKWNKTLELFPTIAPLLEESVDLECRCIKLLLNHVARIAAWGTYRQCRWLATPSTKEGILTTPSTKQWIWLERQIRNKKLADGTIATFPRLVDGIHRNPDEPGHWYWFLAWGDSSKKRKYLPRHRVFLVKSLINSGKSLEMILLHMTPSDDKGGVA